MAIGAMSTDNALKFATRAQGHVVGEGDGGFITQAIRENSEHGVLEVHQVVEWFGLPPRPRREVLGRRAAWLAPRRGLMVPISSQLRHVRIGCAHHLITARQFLPDSRGLWAHGGTPPDRRRHWRRQQAVDETKLLEAAGGAGVAGACEDEFRAGVEELVLQGEEQRITDQEVFDVGGGDAGNLAAGAGALALVEVEYGERARTRDEIRRAVVKCAAPEQPVQHATAAVPWTLFLSRYRFLQARRRAAPPVRLLEWRVHRPPRAWVNQAHPSRLVGVARVVEINVDTHICCFGFLFSVPFRGVFWKKSK